MKTSTTTTNPYDLGLKTFKTENGVWFNPDFRSEFNGAFGNYFFTKEIAIENYNSQMMFNEVNHTFVEAELEGIVYYRYIGTNIWD